MRRSRQEQKEQTAKAHNWIADMASTGAFDEHDGMQAALEAHSRFDVSIPYRAVLKIIRSV